MVRYIRYIIEVRVNPATINKRIHEELDSLNNKEYVHSFKKEEFEKLK